MASYMQNRTSGHVTIEQLMWIPTLQGCFPFAMLVGGFLSSKLEPRAATFIGCSCMTGSVFLSSITIRSGLALFLLSYGVLFGLGQGIAYVVAVSSVINWAPHRVGLFSGLVAGAFGVSAAIFTPIQTRLINPENYVAVNGYFSEPELLDRVPNVFLTLGGIYAIMQLIGLVFICDPPSELQSELDDPTNPHYIRRCLSDSFVVDPNWRWLGTPRSCQQNDGTMTVTQRRVKNPRRTDGDLALLIESDAEFYKCDNDDKKADDGDMTLRQVLRSSTFYALFVTLFCCSFYGNLYYNLYKTFSNTFIDDDMFMAVAFSVGTVANAAGRIGWGIVADKFSFQLALTSAVAMATILLFTMPLTPYGGKPMYFIWLILLFINIAANQTLFITAAVKCFGSKHKALNYGTLILSTTISGILLSAVCQTLLGVIGYTWMFIAAGCIALIAFVVSILTRFTAQGRAISIRKRAVKKRLNFIATNIKKLRSLGKTGPVTVEDEEYHMAQLSDVKKEVLS
uniref:MFS domain-containing protein n=1 Tax=Panagrellus redivivus TaxID=6233 RepID=A0A7E4W2D7_PANRE